MSTLVPVVVCMAVPPAVRAPKSSPARTVPSGRDRPSRATVMASKPTDPAMEVVRLCCVPSTGPVAARPHSAPETTMTRAVTRGTPIPAVRAACGLEPVARNWKPNSLRSMSHHTSRAATRATTKPRWRRKESPSRSGYWAPSLTVRDLGLVLSPLKARVVRAWMRR